MGKTLLQPLLSRREVAEYLGLDKRSVDAIIKRGELRTVTVGLRTVRIPAESLAVYLEKGGAK